MLLVVAGLVAPPLLTLACLRLAMAVDRLRLGPPWQLIVVYLVGPGALTAGLAGAMGMAHLVAPGSRLGRAAVITAGFGMAFATFVLAYPVTGWK